MVAQIQFFLWFMSFCLLQLEEVYKADKKVQVGKIKRSRLRNGRMDGQREYRHSSKEFLSTPLEPEKD